MKPIFLLSLALLARSVVAAPAPKTLPRATQLKIESLLRHPQLQNAHVGVAIVALGQANSPAQFPAAPYDNKIQPLLFERDSKKHFLPASNFKLFTAAWVLHQLGPQRTFVTRAIQTSIVAAKVGAWPSGTPYPSVITLFGDGDPSLSTGDLKAMASAIRAQNSGVFVVLAAEGLFGGGSMNAEEGGGRYPDGWTLDDALWYYGPPISALAINRNQIDVTLSAAAKIGETATLQIAPDAPFPIFAPVLTVAPSDPRAGQLKWTRGDSDSPLSETLFVEGFLAQGKSDMQGIAVPNPRAWAQSLLAGALRDNGATVVAAEGFYGQKNEILAAQHASPPLSFLLRHFLKTSDNLYGEMLLRRAAVEVRAQGFDSPQIASTGLAARAHGAMLQWLQKSGVPTAGVRFSDGSGLSRYDLATPISLARLLGAVEKIRGGEAFYNALPIAGVDGSLKKRMKGSAAQGNVRAKTGTFAIANCLTGYVTTRDGQRLAVSILTNGVEDGELARNWQGRVFATLADANFRK